MKKFNVKRFLLFILILIVLCVVALYFTYSKMISAPSDKSEEVRITVNNGDTYGTIANMLKEKGLIRNVLAYKIYIKRNTPSKGLEKGDYILKTNYNLKELINTLEKGSISVGNTKTVTFVEGKNMRYIIKTITSNFDISEEEILNQLKDTNYLDSLINDYWFLTKDIKNKKIYYSLEGYLYPDTYEFYTTASVDDIFRKLLDNMENKLDNYKDEIDKSKYSVHEIMTLASIIELEAGKADDRAGVAGVFYNRLRNGWSLGSDVTTYYAAKIDLSDRDLKMSEIKDCNAYNTRATCMVGKLPVGPICNPSIGSLIASIEPKSHKYYYFVADKNGKTYFNETDSGHTSTVARLKREGLWFEY